MSGTPIVIAGISTAVPPHGITQEAAAQGTVPFCCETPEQARILEGLFGRSGVELRYSVLLKGSRGSMAERQDFYPPRSSELLNGPTTGERMQYFEHAAPALAVEASQKALADAHIDPQRITHLITVTCTGFSAPGFDHAIITQLPLRNTVSRVQVGFMGCHAALNAIRVARAFVAADPQSVVLVCCVELCTLHYQYGWDPEQIVAMSLFGDGAAACVVRAQHSLPSAGQSRFVIRAHGSRLVEGCADAMTWTIADHGFRMTLSPRVPNLLAEHLKPWLTTWLGEHNFRVEDIANWAVHPGGPRILQAFVEATGVAPHSLEASRHVLANYGNMSSPTLLFVLDILRLQARPLVAIGFGPGLTIEAMLLA